MTRPGGTTLRWLRCTKRVCWLRWGTYYIPCVWRTKIMLMQTEQAFPNLEVEQNEGRWTQIYCCFCDCRILAYNISACEVCIIWRKPIAACKIQCHSPSRQLAEANDGLTDNKIRLFQCPCCDHVGVHIGIRICTELFEMWNSSTNSVLARVTNFSKT